MAAEAPTQMAVDSEPVTQTMAAAGDDTAMEVDQAKPERGMKRSAEEETEASSESHKKARVGE